MTDLDLNELERLEKAATPGPWKWDSDQIKDDPMNRCRYRVCVVGKTVMQTYYSSDDVHAEADATLTCALRNALPELLRRLRAAEADRIAHERAAHEADLRTQAAVRAENAAQARVAELEAHLQSIIEAYDANSGAEPSVSVLDRAIDAARRP